MFDPYEVLDFWFPDDGHWETLQTHMAFWRHRMRGGVDEEIRSRFADITNAAARGELDDWAGTPSGRLALLIALDQFPRSLWRGDPAAYGQDIKATLLALEGIGNGHYDALRHSWERQFYIIAISHCEGPDHLERMKMVIDMSRANAQTLLPHLAKLAERSVEQAELVHSVISRFGRHPHRNAVLGRPSTIDEEAYIAKGEFPHERDIPSSPNTGVADTKASRRTDIAE